MLWKGFQKPKQLEFDAESLTTTYGRFWAQPYERGFGITVGNAVRRILLSSIEGAAITAVKLDGVRQSKFHGVRCCRTEEDDLVRLVVGPQLPRKDRQQVARHQRQDQQPAPSGCQIPP